MYTHTDRHVRAVGDLHAQPGEGGAEGPHGEWDDVHGAARHAAGVQTVHLSLL